MYLLDNLPHLRSRVDVLSARSSLATFEFLAASLEFALAIGQREPGLAIPAGICAIAAATIATINQMTVGEYRVHEHVDKAFNGETLKELVPTLLLPNLPVDFDEDVLPAERNVMNE